MKLTDTAIRKAKPQAAPYRIADGGGMYIEITTNGSKYWRMAYRFAGKQKTLALGIYPDVTLAEARERRTEARKQLANGADPGAVKQTQKKQSKIAAANSFELIAREFHKLKTPTWSVSHTADWIKTLEREIFPKFGELPISEIEAPDVLDAIRTIEGRGAHEVAARVLQRVRAVCAYAIATGRARHNPASEIKGALAPQPKVKHFAALTEKELPEFLRAVAAYPCYPLTKAATRLLMLTFVRTGEVRGAKWREFDHDAKLWVIPAERMKAREPHVVPLSRQAIETLTELHQLTGHDEHLFPSRTGNGRTISENTVLKVIERLGYKGRMTGHGFRTIASTYLNSVGMIRPDIIEAQLAHTDGNATRAAYNRTDYMEYRIAMMQFWADTLDAMQAGEKLPKWADYEPHDLEYRAAQAIPIRAKL
ncbi:MAG: tyrosine-type recombinase/integrase [Nitrosomonas sp.]|uniref:tyrosine-type recombinase/integrase n=1 Tax=Nitrosomonas sp. TaxID=42353 RepID=UPI001A512D61|nr:integrase arm-type DNA-binding domain-containing protein [Nitrosomonas sp.]MBL8500467.1 tyrosine-type recombinase/integrase [Nitrosomonas sp.]UJP04308.1 MAG: tyrosine-type recombinase/integrase [Nitrosomonas sp.]